MREFKNLEGLYEFRCTTCGATLSAHTDWRDGRQGHAIDAPGQPQHGYWHEFRTTLPAMPPIQSTLIIEKTAPTRATSFPSDAAGRKAHPVASGVLDYFPDALVA